MHLSWALAFLGSCALAKNSRRLAPLESAATSSRLSQSMSVGSNGLVGKAPFEQMRKQRRLSSSCCDSSVGGEEITYVPGVPRTIYINPTINEISHIDPVTNSFYADMYLEAYWIPTPYNYSSSFGTTPYQPTLEFLNSDSLAHGTDPAAGALYAEGWFSILEENIPPEGLIDTWQTYSFRCVTCRAPHVHTHTPTPPPSLQSCRDLQVTHVC